MMDCTPTPAFRQAAMEILGSDSPAAIFGAIRAPNRRPINVVLERHMEIQDTLNAGKPVPPLSPAAAAVRDELSAAYAHAGLSPDDVWADIARRTAEMDDDDDDEDSDNLAHTVAEIVCDPAVDPRVLAQALDTAMARIGTGTAAEIADAIGALHQALDAARSARRR